MLETMKRILTMAGKYRHKVTIGIIISLLHSFFSAMDLFAILYISFSINTLAQQKIGVAAAILLVGLTGKIICKYQITEHISGSSYDVFYEKRLEAGEKLKRVPMGYFSEKNLGEIQMAMTTDMNALESSAMSVVENILGSLIYAAVCTLVLLLFNWRIGAYYISGPWNRNSFCSVSFKKTQKVMPVRFQAQEEMTEKTLEFIQGNMVMRLFGTGRDGLNRVKEAFHKKQESRHSSGKYSGLANQLLQIHISTGELWSSIDCRIALCKTRNDISYLCYVPFCGFSCLLTDGWTCLQYCSATNCRYCS